jgi:hypothetical protein
MMVQENISKRLYNEAEFALDVFNNRELSLVYTTVCRVESGYERDKYDVPGIGKFGHWKN